MPSNIVKMSRQETTARRPRVRVLTPEVLWFVASAALCEVFRVVRIVPDLVTAGGAGVGVFSSLALSCCLVALVTGFDLMARECGLVCIHFACHRTR
jgi:hypothetical protein